MIHLLPDQAEQLSLPLAALLSLQDAQLPAGGFAMRPLNQAHIQRLAASRQEQWPAILVTRCSAGYLVIDGNHRWQAALLKQAGSIQATCQSYPSPDAIIDAAFQANLTHGLQASFSTRGDYASWLHVTFPALRQEQIAERVGLTQSAVSKVLAKRARAGQPEESTDPTAAAEETAQRATRRLVKAALHFLQEVDGLSDEEVGTLFSPEDRTRIARLARLLGPAPVSALRLRQFLSPQRPNDSGVF